MADLSKEVDTLASDAAYYLIPLLEAELHSDAEAGGWPIEIYSQLTIVYENGCLVVSYPQAIESQVNDLEYGAEGQAPRAIIRGFSYRADAAIKSVLANDTVDLLMQYEEVF